MSRSLHTAHGYQTQPFPYFNKAVTQHSFVNFVVTWKWLGLVNVSIACCFLSQPDNDGTSALVLSHIRHHTLLCKLLEHLLDSLAQLFT